MEGCITGVFIEGDGEVKSKRLLEDCLVEDEWEERDGAVIDREGVS
jgi:hypothetical protein